MSLHWKFLLHQIVSCFGPISTSLPGEKMPQRKQVNFPVKSDQLENETLKKKSTKFQHRKLHHPQPCRLVLSAWGCHWLCFCTEGRGRRCPSVLVPSWGKDRVISRKSGVRGIWVWLLPAMGAPWKLWCLGKTDSGFFTDRRMTEAELLL